MASSSADPIETVSLVVELHLRPGGAAADAYMINAIAEKSTDGAVMVKRPGLKVLQSMPASVGVGTAQGFLNYGDGFVWLYNGYFGFFTPPGSTWTGTPQAHGFPEGAGCRYRVYHEYNYNAYHPGGVGLTSAGLVQGPYGVYTMQHGSGTFGTPFTWTFYQTASVIPSSGTLLPSLSELDNTYYVFDTKGTIWASAIGDVSTWPALNSVIASPEIGQPTAMIRHLNYLVCFGTHALQFFYDAGLSPGAPIQAVANGTIGIGMLGGAGNCLAASNGQLFWVGTTAGGGCQVFTMAGESPQKISSPAVERLLETYLSASSGGGTGGANGASDVMFNPEAYPQAFVITSGGHSYYLIEIPVVLGGGLTLAFDLTTQLWTYWNRTYATGLSTYFGITAVTATPATTATGTVFQNSNQPAFPVMSPGYNGLPYPILMQDTATGAILTLDTNTFQDAGQPIVVTVQTDRHSWGSSKTKLIPCTYLNADNSSGNATLYWTDDDYVTYTAAIPVALSNTKKQIVRCGSTIARAWKLVHTNNTAFRAENLEIEARLGAL